MVGGVVRFQIRDLRRELAAKALETREWQRKAEQQATTIARTHHPKASPLPVLQLQHKPMDIQLDIQFEAPT